eukprot:1708207-Pyramimonas_sp.AAC.1
MWPGNGVLGRRRTRSGPQLSPGNQNVAWEWCSGKTKDTKWLPVGSGHSSCGPGMAGNGVLERRRTRSGPQLALGNQNVAWEWYSGKTKNTKWPTVGSGHSKCGLGVVFWEHEGHE